MQRKGNEGIRGTDTSAVMVIMMAALFLSASGLDRALVFFSAEQSALPLAGGIAFIAVLRLRLLGALIVFAASFAVATYWGVPLAVNLKGAALDTAVAVLGVVFFRHVISDRPPFGDIVAVMAFLVFGTALPFLVVALVEAWNGGMAVLASTGGILITWLGGVAGCIVGAPLAGMLITSPTPERRTTETAVLLGATAFLSLTFSGTLDLASETFPLQYLMFPLLLWALFRAGIGVAIVILVTGLIATLWGTTEGFGPFVRESVTETALLLQAFFGVTGVTVLILHATLAERRAALDDLEARVEERTADLHDAKREAEEANKTKSRFLAAASHDLRQPIHAISLFSTALHTRLKERKNARLVSKVQRSLSSLGGMLDGLLDMSRLENDAIVPQRHDFPVQAILDDIVTEHTPAAQAGGLDLRVVPSSSMLCSDQALLSRIIGNFVSNAVRYTDTGRILVGCRLRGDCIRLEVWDTGKGMSADEVGHIFDPYRRLDGARKQAADGLGLGLAISDGLARLLDHPITVQSTPGAGSRFVINVPKGADQTAAEDIDAPTPSYTGAFQGHNVLVVDDDEAVLDGMQTVLSDWGCRVVTARDTESALAHAQALGDDLDVVISDYHLSETETGVALLDRIGEETDRPVPAIIISGDTQPERRREIEAAGHFLLTKPIQPVSLRPLLRRQLRTRD